MEKRVRELEVGFASQSAETDTQMANILSRLARIEVGILGLIGMALGSCVTAIWFLLTHNIHMLVSPYVAGG